MAAWGSHDTPWMCLGLDHGDISISASPLRWNSLLLSLSILLELESLEALVGTWDLARFWRTSETSYSIDIADLHQEISMIKQLVRDRDWFSMQTCGGMQFLAHHAKELTWASPKSGVWCRCEGKFPFKKAWAELEHIPDVHMHAFQWPRHPELQGYWGCLSYPRSWTQAITTVSSMCKGMSNHQRQSGQRFLAFYNW